MRDKVTGNRLDKCVASIKKIDLEFGRLNFESPVSSQEAEQHELFPRVLLEKHTRKHMLKFFYYWFIVICHVCIMSLSERRIVCLFLNFT